MLKKSLSIVFMSTITNFSFAGTIPYDEAGFGIQISTSSVAPVYYAASKQYTVGIELSPLVFVKNTDQTEGNKFTVEPFARYNFPIARHVTVGPGIFYQKFFGNSSNQHHDWGVAQFFNIEYSATSNILFSANLNTIKYHTNIPGETVDSHITLLGGSSVMMTYKF